MINELRKKSPLKDASTKVGFILLKMKIISYLLQLTLNKRKKSNFYYFGFCLCSRSSLLFFGLLIFFFKKYAIVFNSQENLEKLKKFETAANVLPIFIFF